MAFRYRACMTLDRLVGQQTAVIAISEAAALEFLKKAENNQTRTHISLKDVLNMAS